MRGNGGVAVAAVFGLIILSVIVWSQVSLWQECRAQHSWYYCFRVVGGR